MSPNTHGGARADVEIPSMLDLVRLSRRLLFPPGGVDICRQIALLTGMKKGDEVLVVPSGLAVTLEHFVREYDVRGSGVEDDPTILDQAEARLRANGMLERVHVQPGPMDDLPFRDGIFDIVIAELGVTARTSAESAVAEIVRVAKPGAGVVLVQPVWKAPVDSLRREILSRHLGCRPIMVVEWKRLLRDAGVEGLHTEDWSDEETAFRPQISKPFPDFSEMFTYAEKLGILRQARRRWGWAGVRTALARAREVHNLLTRERVLGLDLVAGQKRGTDSAVREPGRAARVPGPAVRGLEPTVRVPEPTVRVPGQMAMEAAAGGPSSAVEPPVEAVPETSEEAVPETSAEAVPEAKVTGLPLFMKRGEP